MPAKSKTPSKKVRSPSSSSDSSKEEKSTSPSTDVKPPTRSAKIVQRKKPVSSSGSSSDSEVRSPVVIKFGEKTQTRFSSKPISKTSSEKVTSSESESEEVKKPTKPMSKTTNKKVISSSESSSSESEEVKKSSDKKFVYSSDSDSEDNSSDSEIEVIETTEYKGKNKFSKLPEDILNLIANMLGGNDKLSLIRSSGLYQSIISKMHLDLSNKIIELSKLVMMKDELIQFKSLSLNILVDTDTRKIKPLAHKITDLILDTLNKPVIISNFKDCPLRSLELMEDVGLGFSDVLIFPNIERIITNSPNYDNVSNKYFEIPTKLKYLDIVNVEYGKEHLLESSMPNLETLILRKNYGPHVVSKNYLNSCINLKVLELYDYYDLRDFTFLEHLKKLEKFVFVLTEHRDVVPAGNNLTFKTPNLKYVMMKYINATEYDFTRCPKLEKLHLIQNSYNDDNSNKVFLDGCEKLNELVLVIFLFDNYNFLSSCPSLKRLKLECAEIENLEGLENCTNLEELDISSSQLEDISQLSTLINLRKLRIRSEQVGDISSLSNCLNLETLNLNGTSVSDLTPISECTKLTRLMLRNSNVTTLRPLVKLKELTYVNLFGTSIKNVNVCVKWPKLVYLNLQDVVDLKSLKGLGRCSQLKYLYLENTSIVSLEGLENCRLLETLICEDCTNLRDISSLFNHSELRELILNKTLVRNIDSFSSCTKLVRLILTDNRYMKDTKKAAKNLSHIEFQISNERDIDSMEFDDEDD